MLGAGPTFGHPTGLIRRPVNAPLTKMTSRAVEMRNVKGRSGIEPSGHLAFRHSERAGAMRRKRKRASVAGSSSRQSETGAAPAALLRDMSAFAPFSSGQNGESSGEGPPVLHTRLDLFRPSEKSDPT